VLRDAHSISQQPRGGKKWRAANGEAGKDRLVVTALYVDGGSVAETRKKNDANGRLRERDVT
jgi:hypothetical protein